MTPEKTMIALDEKDSKYLDQLAAKIAQAVAARQAVVEYLYAKYEVPVGMQLDLAKKAFTEMPKEGV